MMTRKKESNLFQWLIKSQSSHLILNLYQWKISLEKSKKPTKQPKNQEITTNKKALRSNKLESNLSIGKKCLKRIWVSPSRKCQSKSSKLKSEELWIKRNKWKLERRLHYKKANHLKKSKIFWKKRNLFKIIRLVNTFKSTSMIRVKTNLLTIKIFWWRNWSIPQWDSTMTPSKLKLGCTNFSLRIIWRY